MTRTLEHVRRSCLPPQFPRRHCSRTSQHGVPDIELHIFTFELVSKSQQKSEHTTTTTTTTTPDTRFPLTDVHRTVR